MTKHTYKATAVSAKSNLLFCLCNISEEFSLGSLYDALDDFRKSPSLYTHTIHYITSPVKESWILLKKELTSYWAD